MFSQFWVKHLAGADICYICVAPDSFLDSTPLGLQVISFSAETVRLFREAFAASDNAHGWEPTNYHPPRGSWFVGR